MNILEREIQTFERERQALQSAPGRFVLIHDDQVLGTFDTYGDALQAGYKAVGLEPFLVKDIRDEDAVACYSRDVLSVCQP